MLKSKKRVAEQEQILDKKQDFYRVLGTVEGLLALNEDEEISLQIGVYDFSLSLPIAKARGFLVQRPLPTAAGLTWSPQA